MKIQVNNPLERARAIIQEFQRRQDLTLTLVETRCAQQRRKDRLFLTETLRDKCDKRINGKSDFTDGTWAPIALKLMAFYQKTSGYSQIFLTGLNIPLTLRSRTFALNTLIAYCTSSKAERRDFIQNILDGQILRRMPENATPDPTLKSETFLSLLKSIHNFQDRMLESQSQMNIWEHFSKLPPDEMVLLNKAIGSSLLDMEQSGQDKAIRYLTNKLTALSNSETARLLLQGINPFSDRRHLKFCSPKLQETLGKHASQIWQEMTVFSYLFLTSNPQKRAVVREKLSSQQPFGPHSIELSTLRDRSDT